MESHDRDLIFKFISSDVQLRKLYEEHKSLDAKINKMGNRRYLTNDEEQEHKQLKQKKLQGVDRMISIVREYEERHEAA